MKQGSGKPAFLTDEMIDFVLFREPHENTPSEGEERGEKYRLNKSIQFNIDNDK